jgi:hypothetical protein
MPSQMHPFERCDGVARREFLRVGGLTALGLGLSDWHRLRAAAQTTERGNARACILIWLDGGPSHLDTFDLKPEAPSEVRGPFSPIPTNVAGTHICEYLPRTARVMDRIALIRSMTSPLGEHNFASQYLLTGYKPTPVLTYPSLGSVVTHTQAGRHTLPPHIGVDRPNEAALGGYLPATADPFVILADPSKPEFHVEDLEPYAAVTMPRLERRRQFLAALDAWHRSVEQADHAPHDAGFEQAYRLMTSPQAKAAFDLEHEPRELRDRYGRHRLGQSCLLARRLVEAGVQFVTVTDRGWDTHDSMFNRLKEGYTGGTVGLIPRLDSAYASLIDDLHQRGLLDSTLVVLMGEFGRTPKINNIGGRDHWPRVFSVAMAGAGVAGGRVVGASDSRGESPDQRPVTPADLAHTIYKLLGIDPAREFVTGDGRPVRINAEGKLVTELLA